MTGPLRIRLFAALLAVALASSGVLSVYFSLELESYAHRKLETRLTSESLALAQVLAAQIESSQARSLSGAQSESLRENLGSAGASATARVRILDADGVALADSLRDTEVGADYAQTTEVAAALQGETGVAQRSTEDGRVIIAVATPVLVRDRVSGVVYASGETFSLGTLVRAYSLRLVGIALVFLVLVLAVTELLARWISHPVRDLARSASAFAAGDHSVRVRPSGSSEVRLLGVAFNDMADEVQTLVDEMKAEERRKSRFVSDVSHELRTPLTAIRGAAETLLDGDVPEDDARQFLSTIARESERLTQLANDLLTLQRIEGATGELPITRVDLGQTARRTIESLAPLTETRGVRVTLVGSAPPVLGDPNRLQQVLGNLIDNASRMTPEGGTVTIELAAEERRSVVRVLDEGPGIADEDLPHVFERFYRSETSRQRSTGGAGLGLAIVAAIVRAHAGTVTAARRAEGGSVFTINLPSIQE